MLFQRADFETGRWLPQSTITSLAVVNEFSSAAVEPLKKYNPSPLSQTATFRVLPLAGS